MLGIDEKIIEKNGAVSETVVRGMAEGARRLVQYRLLLLQHQVLPDLMEEQKKNRLEHSGLQLLLKKESLLKNIFSELTELQISTGFHLLH